MDQRNGSGYRGHVVPSLVAKSNLILWKVDPTWLLSLNDQTFYTCDISKTKGEEKHTVSWNFVNDSECKLFSPYFSAIFVHSCLLLSDFKAIKLKWNSNKNIFSDSI